MQNYKMLIEYDGTRYQGFQNKNTGTIVSKLQEAVLRVTGEQTTLHAAVRTSPGVHALGQTVSFRLAAPVDTIEFRQKLNHILPQDISIRFVYPAPERFDAALNLQSATVVCRLDIGRIPSIFWRNRTVHMPEELNLEAMKKAAKLLLGSHDFACFSAGRTRKSTVRCITELNLVEDRELHQLIFTLTADGFLRHMPQLVIGTLLDIGTGKLEPEHMGQILGGTCPCGNFLPSKAFCLTETNYL